jgi:hypothetical protein
MTRCHCTSPNCPNPRHTATLCAQPAQVEVQSRDWGEEIIPMCDWCSVDAKLSGMFRRAQRAPKLKPITQTVIDGRFC